MKLQTRLAISFLIMVILPVSLFGVISAGILRYNYFVIDRYYGIEGTNLESIVNPVKLYYQISDQIVQEGKRLLRENPEKMLESSALEEASEQLKEKSTGIIIYRENSLYFKSNMMHEALIPKEISQYQTTGFEDGKVMTQDGKHCIARHLSTMVANQKYDIFVVTYMDGLLHQMKRIIWQGVFAIILILVVVSAVLIRQIYKVTVVPLKLLRNATVSIREGNLDFKLENPCRQEDVISELFDDFEAMRCRLKENADEKIQNDKESKELISNISHDLKTPITAIKGYAEGLVDGVAVTPSMQERYLRTIYKKSVEMDRLIDELTLYSKIDTNRIPYEFKKVNFVEFFSDCADSLRVELEARGILFEYHNLTDGESVIIADVEQFSRIVNNIVSNSIKYTDKKNGKIVMTLRDEGDFVRVEISDNGQGINKKDLPHIFDRFYRSDAARNSAQGGSGIGLSIVKKIVEDHGGRIWAESRECYGTKMCIVLRKYLEV